MHRRKGLSKWITSKLINKTQAISKIQNEAMAEEGQGSETCLHFFEYLTTFQRKNIIPDECLVCPKLMKCMNRYTT